MYLTRDEAGKQKVSVFFRLSVYAFRVCLSDGQIYANITTSLQYQLRHFYNTTGTHIVNTSSVTYRVTVAWDQLQRQVLACRERLTFDL